MKKIAIILLLAVLPNLLLAQNDLKARIEFDEAEKAFSEDKFEECLNYANKAEVNLGIWSSKLCYLKILALDKLCNYQNLENNYTKQQRKEVGLYMAYANKKQDKIDIDRFKIAYQIDEKIKALVKQENEIANNTIQDKKNYAEFKKNEKIYNEMLEYKNGEEALGVKEYEKALKLFKIASEKGNPIADGAIGVMYEVGSGVPENNTEAIKWYSKAADKGNIEALYYMRDIYEDDKKNFNVLFRCANAGYEDCYSYLASAYRFGKGVAPDFSKALQYYIKDAEKGDFLDIENIAELYNSGGPGLVESKAEAFKWYMKAATLTVYREKPFSGSKKSMYKLYQMYNTGEGIQKNPKEAFKWLLKMAEVEEDDQTATEFDWIGEAYYKLGTAYYKGLSVEQNYAESLKWYTKGSIKTKKAMWYTKYNVQCMQIIVQFYQEGLGVKRDKKLAAEWLAKAVEADKIAR